MVCSKINLLAVFLATVGLAVSYPSEVKTWTAPQLFEDIKRPDLDPYIKDLHLNALLMIVGEILSGNDTSVCAAVPSPSGQDSWTAEELDEVKINQPYHPYWDELHIARKNLEFAIWKDFKENTVPVCVLALDISLWTHNDIERALKSDRTDPELVPLLVEARQALKKSKKETVGLVTRIGLVQHKGKPEFLPMPKESVYTWAQENNVPIKIHKMQYPIIEPLIYMLDRIYTVFNGWFG